MAPHRYKCSWNPSLRVKDAFIMHNHHHNYWWSGKAGHQLALYWPRYSGIICFRTRQVKLEWPKWMSIQSPNLFPTSQQHVFPNYSLLKRWVKHLLLHCGPETPYRHSSRWFDDTWARTLAMVSIQSTWYEIVWLQDLTDLLTGPWEIWMLSW